jgi:hypothetical protein
MAVIGTKNALEKTESSQGGFIQAAEIKEPNTTHWSFPFTKTHFSEPQKKTLAFETKAKIVPKVKSVNNKN